ncbi:MAG: discoidin domain-containing protein [Verrucomicrobia bacterium]|nr:discoidin domain-containing protein [Verrucomicrobiota bacterium]
MNGFIGDWWASEVSDEQWIRVDLEGIREIGRVLLYWGNHPTRFKVQVSDDGEHWKTAAEDVPATKVEHESRQRLNPREIERGQRLFYHEPTLLHPNATPPVLENRGRGHERPAGQRAGCSRRKSEASALLRRVPALRRLAAGAPPTRAHPSETSFTPSRSKTPWSRGSIRSRSPTRAPA